MVEVYQCSRSNVPELHGFCSQFPELKVSSQSEFMSLDELDFAILSPGSVSRYAKADGKIVGFCLGTIVYLAVAEQYRHQGIGLTLLKEVVDVLRTKGVSYIYSWACPTSGMVDLCKRAGMLPGRTCVWMDMRLDF